MPLLNSLSVVVILPEFVVGRLCIIVVTAWLVVYTTIWVTVYMSKCIKVLKLSRVKLLKSVRGFLVSSNIVLKIESEELKSRVLNTLLKVFTTFNTLLSKSETSVNIQKQC